MAYQRKSLLLACVLTHGLLAGCSHDPSLSEPKASATNVVPRADFNRIAAELGLPIFWLDDSNDNGSIDPNELSSFWGLSASADNTGWMEIISPKAFSLPMKV